MKVLLRGAQTGLYWGGGGSWVREPAEALAFPTIPAAGDNARTCGEEEVDVVLKFDESECELALNPAFCGRVPPAGSNYPLLIPA